MASFLSPSQRVRPPSPATRPLFLFLRRLPQPDTATHTMNDSEVGRQINQAGASPTPAERRAHGPGSAPSRAPAGGRWNPRPLMPRRRWPACARRWCNSSSRRRRRRQMRYPWPPRRRAPSSGLADKRPRKQPAARRQPGPAPRRRAAAAAAQPAWAAAADRGLLPGCNSPPRPRALPEARAARRSSTLRSCRLWRRRSRRSGKSTSARRGKWT